MLEFFRISKKQTPNKAIELLGFRGKDKITGMSGVITSVSFDLYGCSQVVLTPTVESKHDARWFDISRIDVDKSVKVMEPPSSFVEDKGPDCYKPVPT